MKMIRFQNLSMNCNAACNLKVVNYAKCNLKNLQSSAPLPFLKTDTNLFLIGVKRLGLKNKNKCHM